LTLFFLIIITNNSFGQVKLENEILSGFVKSYFSHNEKDKIYIVLMKVTVSNEFDTQKRSLSSFHYNGPAIFHMGLKLIDAIMYSDFIEKNKTKIAVDTIRNFEGNILYLSENERDMIFKNRGWETFRFRYGEKPLVSLSRPGINVKKNRALIYFEYSTGGLAGTGMYVILDKLNGKWIVKESMEIWES
jgi:hypothetical protein